jgi:hypothetical protein
MRLFFRPVLLASIGFFALIELSFAGCSSPVLTSAKHLELRADSALIVTHASGLYDPRYSTKTGLDTVVSFAKQNKIPVIYLVDDSPIRYAMMDDCEPSHWVRSVDGEVDFSVDVKHLILAGGHMELCLSRSAHDLIEQAAKRSEKILKVSYVMDAIYSNGKTINETDPFYRDFQWFMGIVNYGRPGGEQWPKLNLLETTGIIKSIENDYLYLRELLPRWDRTFPKDTRVELKMDDFPSRVLQKGSRESARVQFHFVNSADLIN